MTEELQGGPEQSNNNIHLSKHFNINYIILDDASGDSNINEQLEQPLESDEFNSQNEQTIDDIDIEQMSREELLSKIKEAFDQLLELAESDEISPVLLQKVLKALSKPKTPSAGTASLVAIYRSLNTITRRGSYIAVNPTGRARRRKGVSMGKKRVPMGRPSKAEQKVRGKPKKARNLSQCVNANVANSKSH